MEKSRTLIEAERACAIAVEAANKRAETALHREVERSRARRRAIQNERNERIARAEASLKKIRDKHTKEPAQ